MTDSIKWDASAPLVMTGQLYISPAAQPNSITYRNTSDSTEILRITKDGVHANPDVPVDEAAQAVLAALDNGIKTLVKKAREDDTALLRQALEALRFSVPERNLHVQLYEATITALRGRLEETK